ncbi:MAG: hypothetical protein IBJ03_07180 [Gemmatimonadaceae bacterium]|nr:hypothetical protein [Gemmatimonadaceae bacterium]
MPVRLPPLADPASVILLEAMVDYAGLYPPAALAMPAAVRNYAHYRASGSGWMLGRFVCPANQLELFSEKADPLLPRDAGAIPWRLAVTSSGDVSADLAGIAAFNERHRVCFDECGAKVDVYEAKAQTVEDVQRLASLVPQELVLYIELPVNDDIDALVQAVAAAGRRAKIRTGGVTADAFPAAAQIVRFLRACLAHDVPAKATAGLHHPLRGAYRLTYDVDATTGKMFGFLNVLLASALLSQGGSDADAVALLEESDGAAFEIGDTQITWRNALGSHVFSKHVLRQSREHVLTSVGSCSFTEPVDESRALGWL